MDEFPSNSQRAKAPPAREAPPALTSKDRKVERIVHSEVIRRKRPFSKRILEFFVPEEGPSIQEQILEGIIKPHLKDMLYYSGIGSLERMIYRNNGVGRPGGPRVSNGIGHIAYNAFASKPVGVKGPGGPSGPTLSQRGRATHNFDEILIPSRQEAVVVLQGLYDMLEQYNEVSVRDLYEMVGISSNWAESPWGWTDLMGARILPARDGYFVLDLPRPKLLEK